MRESGLTNYQVIYILGSGHSGSTLLDLLLGTHPQILSCGELDNLARYRSSDKHRCACGEPVPHCSFWREVNGCLQERDACLDRTDFDLPSWRQVILLSRARRNDLARTYGGVNRELFGCLASVNQKSFIVDSSKQAQRLFFLERSKMIDLKVIHLVRDGRAVMNSFLRKYGSARWWRGIYRWTSPNVVGLLLRRRFGSQRWLNISYEGLSAKTESTLTEICHFLDITYDPIMLNFKGRVAHNIAGNSGVLNSPTADIRMDQRWKYELKFRYRVAFGLAAGWLNKLLKSKNRNG